MDAQTEDLNLWTAILDQIRVIQSTTGIWFCVMHWYCY